MKINHNQELFKQNYFLQLVIIVIILILMTGCDNKQNNINNNDIQINTNKKDESNFFACH